MTRAAIAFALALAGGLLLGACSRSDVADWDQRRQAYTPEIRWTQTAHAVRFTEGSGGLTLAEEARLDTFLDQQRANWGDRIALNLPAALSPAETAARARAVEAVLNRRGLRLASADAKPGTALVESQVVLGRHLVAPPGCPDWSKPAGADPYNLPGANFGCASAHNLAVMVADPGDLVLGREPGGADGVGAALAIERYRTDKVRPLVREGTSE